jgi:hypothetical protein
VDEFVRQIIEIATTKAATNDGKRLVNHENIQHFVFGATPASGEATPKKCGDHIISHDVKGLGPNFQP